MPDYGSAAYWDERYSADENAMFDWYQGYDALKPHLLPFLKAGEDVEIYVPGCGNSNLSAKLYEDGYLNISNTDVSSVVISQMQERYSEYKEMEFSVLDATIAEEDIPADEEPLLADCFDLTIDKALLDSLLCADDGFKKARVYLNEMHRVLKPGGVLAVLSFAAPDSRMGYFKADGLDWEVSHSEIEKPPLESFKEAGASETHHLYVCRKASA